MSSRQVIIISMCVVAVGALAVVWAATSASQPISMRVLEFTAHRSSDQMGSRGYMVATIELTNASRRPITYWARYEARFPECTVLHQTPTGWKEPAPRFWLCGTGLYRFTLPPSHVITFDAAVERDKPYNYSDGRTPSRLWQRLPKWLRQRLPTLLAQKLPWTREWS